MARSASDATRFTPTTPYASAKPQPSSIKMGHGAPTGESPQQKVARLRAAAAMARAGKESNFDRVIRVGRRWADRAHRVTAYSLIGLTVLSGVTASFAIGDMLMHNRRKRNEWLAEQQAKHREAIQEARVAFASGMADEDQKLLLNQERTKEEAALLKKNKPGVFSSLFSSAPKEEQQGGNLGAAVRAAASDAQESAADLGIVKAVEDKVEQGKRKVGHVVDKTENMVKLAEVSVVGGPLDREAEASAQALAEKSKSWKNWLLRRS